MSGLIKSELTIFIVMTGCGMAAGLLAEIFKSCAAVRGYGQFGRTVMEIILFVLIGVMISEFFYYCDNGKITVTGIGSFLIGLWLWKKFFCGILTLTEADNDEEKRRGKHF